MPTISNTFVFMVCSFSNRKYFSIRWFSLTDLPLSKQVDSIPRHLGKNVAMLNPVFFCPTLPSLNGSMGTKRWFIRVDNAYCMLRENTTHIIYIFSLRNWTKARTNCHRAGQSAQLFTLHKQANGSLVDIIGMFMQAGFSIGFILDKLVSPKLSSRCNISAAGVSTAVWKMCLLKRITAEADESRLGQIQYLSLSANKDQDCRCVTKLAQRSAKLYWHLHSLQTEAFVFEGCSCLFFFFSDLTSPSITLSWLTPPKSIT